MKEEILGGINDDEPGSIQTCISVDKVKQAEFKRTIRTIDDLTAYIPLDLEKKKILTQVARTYHMRIPQYYLSLIRRPFSQDDPIARQCIPSPEEMRDEKISSIDPLNEQETSPVSCLVHRYPDRALLLVTGKCFMYCRHCTRKRLWKNERSEPTLDDIDGALEYLRKTPGIREVIISGGDPFTLPSEKLDYILSALARLKNIACQFMSWHILVR